MAEQQKTFAQSYGEVVALATSLLNFVLQEKWKKDGKVDIGAIVQALVPILSNIDNFQALVQDAEKFIDPAMSQGLGEAFKKNFELENAKTENIVEDAHSLVLSVIRLIVKFTEGKA